MYECVVCPCVVCDLSVWYVYGMCACMNMCIYVCGHDVYINVCGVYARVVCGVCVCMHICVCVKAWCVCV